MVLDSLPRTAAAENNTVPAATEELHGTVSGQMFKQNLALVQLGGEERGNGHVCLKLQILNERRRLPRQAF